MNSCTLFQRTSPRKRWSSALISTVRRIPGWPSQVLQRLLPSPERDPLSAVSGRTAAPGPAKRRGQSGAFKITFPTGDECDEENKPADPEGRGAGPDQKTAFVNEAAKRCPTSQRMIDRFRAGDWPFLLLETEQCRISIRTLDAPEGNCAVTIILKHHGQWKALTKAFPTELGVSMFLDCYEQGCLYQDFNGWYDATDNFQNSVQDVRNSVEEAPSALRPGNQTNRETAEMKKTNLLYVLAWYVPPILLIPALFMFLVRVVRVNGFWISVSAACASDRGHPPLCAHPDEKKDGEAGGGFGEGLPQHQLQIYIPQLCALFGYRGRPHRVVWKNNPSRLQMADPARSPISVPTTASSYGAPPW